MTDINQEMWEQCKALYKVITYNGTVKAKTFRDSTQMAKGSFKNQMDTGFILPWFDGISDFLDFVEKTLAERGETV